MESQEPASAAARAEEARRRAQEVTDRLTRLSAGRAPDPADLRAAHQHAEQAQERALRSLERAALGHERAAASHERTAAVHEEALRRGLGDPAEHARRAEQHHRDAAADRQEAALDRARRTRAEPAGAGEEEQP